MSVWDCFLFCNELDVLEIRLGTLVPLDERFPPYVRQHRQRFDHLIKDALFHERMISHQQLCWLCDTARWRSRDLDGLDLELGCWEGLSTTVIANARHPDEVVAVDSWEGSASEGPGHPTVLLTKDRDVFEQFRRNVRALTGGNVRSISS
jgi:hypothetical protein